MNDRTPPALPKWPFWTMDLLLVLGCSWMVWQAMPPNDTLDHVILLAGIAGWIFAASIGIWPWVAEFKAQNRFAENKSLDSAIEQIKRLEDVGSRVQAASTLWQAAQDSATRTTAAAKEIQERIHANSKDFMGFVERVNNEEKKHLRLEVEKLRRSEGEWLQIVARLLDHTFALNQAAARSGQAHLISQLSNFQNACREVTRRAGLVPFVPEIGEKFDARAHLTEPPSEPPSESVITEVLATGYTFQSQLLRRALVRVSQPDQPQAPASPPTETASTVEPEPGNENPEIPTASPASNPAPEQENPEPSAALFEPAEEVPQPVETKKPAKRAKKPDPQVLLPF